jgi:hypothetical protein
MPTGPHWEITPRFKSIKGRIIFNTHITSPDDVSYEPKHVVRYITKTVTVAKAAMNIYIYIWL